jgi:hypothetical protein
MKLYSVKTVVKVYHGHRDVIFNWFAHRAPGFFWGTRTAELVADYDELENGSDSYAAGAIDELFDKEEADALAAYLKRESDKDGDETTVKEVEFPFPKNIAGYGAKSV